MNIVKAYDMFMEEQHFRGNSSETISYYKITLNMFLDFCGRDIDVDDFQTSAYGGLTNPTVAAVGGAVSSGAVGVVSSVGSDSAYVNNDYALGNHVVEQSFISNMTDDERNSFVNKL